MCSDPTSWTLTVAADAKNGKTGFCDIDPDEDELVMQLREERKVGGV